MMTTYRLAEDEKAYAALERQRAQMRETVAALRAERLQAAAEREEHWLTQPGLLARLGSRRVEATQSPVWPSLGSRP